MQRIDADISVVVPVYNSKETLKELVSRLKSVLARYRRFEVILVDDCSLDGSYEVIKNIIKTAPFITGIALKRNSGQQCAILCGLRHARYTYTVIIDDDLEQSPEDIIALFEEMQKGYDVVYAITVRKSMRNAGSWMRDVLFRVMTNIPKGKKVSSFRIINEKTRDVVTLAETEFVYISMEILKHTMNIGNIRTKSGPQAKTNYSLFKLMNLYIKIFATYSNCFWCKKCKKTGPCYEVREIVSGEAR